MELTVVVYCLNAMQMGIEIHGLFALLKSVMSDMWAMSNRRTALPPLWTPLSLSTSSAGAGKTSSSLTASDGENSLS